MENETYEIVLGDGTEQPLSYRLGDGGVAEIYLGDELIYKRNGSFVYIELNTK